MISESLVNSEGLIVVTGGTDRIAAAICVDLAFKSKRNFLFIGRGEAHLAPLKSKLQSKGSTVSFSLCDLGDPGHRGRLSASISGMGKVDYLLLGASPAERGTFVERSPEKLQNIVDVGCGGVTFLLSRFLPKMSSGGRILVLSSTGAFQPGPENSVYFATKAYQNALVEAIAFEQRQCDGPRILALCSGPLPTRQDQGAWPLLKRLRSVYLEDVVDRLDHEFERGTVIWVPGLTNKLLRCLVPLLPRGFLLSRVQRMMRAI